MWNHYTRSEKKEFWMMMGVSAIVIAVYIGVLWVCTTR